LYVTPSTTITIGNTSIRQDADGRYCLNDLHKAAGGLTKHKVSNWKRQDQTKELIEEVGKSHKRALVATHGGSHKGTFVVKPLVYAYAMWISPAFSLKVIYK